MNEVDKLNVPTPIKQVESYPTDYVSITYTKHTYAPTYTDSTY